MKTCIYSLYSTYNQRKIECNKRTVFRIYKNTLQACYVCGWCIVVCPKEEKIGQYISFFKSPISVSVVKFEYKGSLLHLCFDEHFGGEVSWFVQMGKVYFWLVSVHPNSPEHTPLRPTKNYFFLQPKTIQNDVVWNTSCPWKFIYK